MSSDSDPSPINNTSATATGEVITALVIVLFLLFVIALILYIRAKHYVGITGRQFPRDPTASPLRRPRPLDPSVLASLPVTAFRCGPEGGALDCAVCLSEFAQGEKARFLPKCGHGFHVECIDMWFHSNSTCPLCRVQVGADEQSVDDTSVDVAEIRDDVGMGSDEGSSSGTSSSTSSGKVWSRGYDVEQGVRVG